MKIRWIPLLLLTILSVSLFLSFAAERDGVLRHVVSFKFKDSATPADIQKVEDDFRALEEKISEIRSIEFGTNVSPEGLNKGFSHCFILTFATESARDIYLEHPAHKAFGSSLEPVLEDVFVIDFWAD